MTTEAVPLGMTLLVALLLGFCATDCAMGEPGVSEGSIAGHEYHPPYTTISCDDKGYCSTTYHSARYVLVVAAAGDLTEVNVRQRLYHQLKDGEPVRVGYRVGRFTGYWYRRKLHLYPESW